MATSHNFPNLLQTRAFVRKTAYVRNPCNHVPMTATRRLRNRFNMFVRSRRGLVTLGAFVCLLSAAAVGFWSARQSSVIDGEYWIGPSVSAKLGSEEISVYDIPVLSQGTVSSDPAIVGSGCPQQGQKLTTSYLVVKPGNNIVCLPAVSPGDAPTGFDDGHGLSLRALEVGSIQAKVDGGALRKPKLVAGSALPLSRIQISLTSTLAAKGVIDFLVVPLLLAIGSALLGP